MFTDKNYPFILLYPSQLTHNSQLATDNCDEVATPPPASTACFKTNPRAMRTYTTSPRISKHSAATEYCLYFLVGAAIAGTFGAQLTTVPKKLAHS